MLPLYKLEQLPRTQRLRKTVKIIVDAEKILAGVAVFCGGVAASSVLDAEKLFYFADTAQTLEKDTLFSAAVREAFGKAAGVLRRAAETGAEDTVVIRRTLNVMRHLILAETGRSPADWDFFDTEGRLDPARRRPFPGMTVYFEDIRSPFNVGAMFRAAESFGAEKVFLSPFCADPHHPRAERSAMGCVDVLPWERCEFFNGSQPDGLQSEGCPVFALETGGTPLADFSFPRQGLLIAGSEELGVSPAALAAADASLGRVTIPCYGAKGSLNVSVAFGIVMQAWARHISAAGTLVPLEL
jgi:TrmH family RNA methyltransferase